MWRGRDCRSSIKMEDEDSASLLCTEREAYFDQEEVEENEFFVDSNNSFFLTETEDDEYVKMLVERESSFESKVVHGSSSSEEDCSIMTHDWLRCARLDAIQWILKTRAFFGFRFQTAYLSVTYFDRFLSKRSVDSEQSWAIRLLSIACLSVAVKMEECNIPTLVEIQMEEFCFESKVIQRMELLVLNTLEWRMSSITPFAYLHYFIARLSGESRLKDLASRTVELIFATVKETDFLDYRPSAIAVAAVFVALDNRLTSNMMELKMNLVSSCGALQREHVFSCYRLMKDLEIAKFELPKYVNSPDLSPIYSSSNNTCEDYAITSIAGGTKRRLQFHEHDRNCKKLHNENEH